MQNHLHPFLLYQAQNNNNNNNNNNKLNFPECINSFQNSLFNNSCIGVYFHRFSSKDIDRLCLNLINTDPFLLRKRAVTICPEININKFSINVYVLLLHKTKKKKKKTKTKQKKKTKKKDGFGAITSLLLDPESRN